MFLLRLSLTVELFFVTESRIHNRYMMYTYCASTPHMNTFGHGRLL